MKKLEGALKKEFIKICNDIIDEDAFEINDQGFGGMYRKCRACDDYRSACDSPQHSSICVIPKIETYLEKVESTKVMLKSEVRSLCCGIIGAGIHLDKEIESDISESFYYCKFCNNIEKDLDKILVHTDDCIVEKIKKFLRKVKESELV